MPNFRKKPVVISAEQWFPDKPVEGVLVPEPGCTIQCEPHIETLEGHVFVSPGDWIITEIIQEKYICKDYIFKNTYVPVDDESTMAFGWDDLADYERAKSDGGKLPSVELCRSIIYLSECDEEE